MKRLISILIALSLFAGFTVIARAGEPDGSYIVIKKDSGKGPFDFYVTRLRSSEADRLNSDPEVYRVIKDSPIELQNIPWGLDRIDQFNLPLNGKYVHKSSGKDVNIYIIDTGVRSTHEQFGGRVTQIFTLFPDDPIEDCNGHGTHVAGIAASRDFGVAPEANIFSLRVFNCAGQTATSSVLLAINYLIVGHKSPAVANFSFGTYESPETVGILDEAADRLTESGVTVIAAAGNDRTDSCRMSPGKAESVISVGATSRNDTMAWFSDYGPCLDIFAPGSDIISLSNLDDQSTTYKSGTSSAAPFVTGVAALILEKHPEYTPKEVRDTIIVNSINGKLQNIPTDLPTVNRLLFSGEKHQLYLPLVNKDQ